jgi:hypothetical protein
MPYRHKRAALAALPANGFHGARLPDFWKGHWRHVWVGFFVDDDQGNGHAVAWRYARL